MENRSNALGVSEVNFQVAGGYIIGEFPGLENVNDVINVIKQTGLLEFVDLGDEYLLPGTILQTDFGIATGSQGPEILPTPIPLSIGQPDINVDKSIT